MNIAVILAGGSGLRCGGNIPKQFVKVLGKPVIAYTLEKFQENSNVDAIEVVCHKDYVDEIKSIVEQYGISKVKWYATGGTTFQMSTMNGVMEIHGKIADDDIVLLHFAVSPMVSDAIIDDAIRVCTKYGNAIPIDEMIMCTCERDEDGLGSSKSVLREKLGGMNGPWAFRYSLVRSLYERAIAEGTLDKMEPHTTSLMFAYGHKIYFSKSATTNLKITRPEDFDVFEGLLLVQKRREAGYKKEDPYEQ